MLAEDISQEVFYHLYEIRDTLELTNERMIKSLIFMATVNKAKVISKNHGNGMSIVSLKMKALWMIFRKK